ncbi:MAG: hypothetical protein AAGA03_01025 [Planctomycetota bacterium]
MSVRKLTASVLAALAMLTGAASVQAQEHFPAADPFEFDPDFNWFEPVYEMDLLDVKPKKRANYGWFATYDRLNLYGSRPELNDPNTAPEARIDSGWGHRYEVGYMLPDKDTGWLFNWTDASVGEYDTLERERANRFVEIPDADLSPFFPGLAVPPRDGNNIGFPFRFASVEDSLNVFSFDSYELNKTWRLEPYHYGGILEPMIGARWIRIRDINQNMAYRVTGDPISPLTITGFLGYAEQLQTAQQITENEIMTGQIGFRYFKHRGKFIFSTGLKVFAGGSWQASDSQIRDEYQIYSLTAATAPAQGDLPVLIIDDKTDIVTTRNEELVVGFDVQAEIGYQLTKMITIRGGFQLIDVASGVWRGGDAAGAVGGGDLDQDLVMLGGTFGITLNR